MSETDKIKFYYGLKGLTLVESLLYSLLRTYADETNVINVDINNIKDFIKNPTRLKFKNLETKGFIERINKNTYKILNTSDNRNIVLSKNKYKDSVFLIYGILKACKREMTSEEIAVYLNCHYSTVTKVLHKIQDVKFKAEWLNNGTTGKIYKWFIGDTPTKEHPNRPDFILYYPDLVEEIEDLDSRLIYAYLYSIKKLNLEPSVTELNNILSKKIKKIPTTNIDATPISKPIKIPLYSEYKGKDLCVLSLVSAYRLKGITAVWSLNAFLKVFNIKAKEASLVCKKLIRKKKLSKPTAKDTEAWKEYIGSTNKFSNAVTVTKEQNIILKYCHLKPLPS